MSCSASRPLSWFRHTSWFVVAMVLIVAQREARAQDDPPPGVDPTPPPAGSGAPTTRPPLVTPTPGTTAPPPANTTIPLPPPLPPPATPDKSSEKNSATKNGNNHGEVGAKPGDVYSEDWWSHTRPIFELHGYFRVRAELFQNFSLGRKDVAGSGELWPHPIGNSYVSTDGTQHLVNLCGQPNAPQNCENKTQAGANMRFRLNPELHISDNLRILSQIDLLDNLVLGSTPGGYYNDTGTSGARVRGAQNGYAPLDSFATTQDPPVAGQNSWDNSVAVKRVWGEYLTPAGLLRFGRMPNHWGLGILANAGDGYDSDWQSTADRIMFITGIKSLDLYFAGAWDFANEGTINSNNFQRQGQAYDAGQLDDVNQYVLVVVRRRNPDLVKSDLANGRLVVNGGLFAVYRDQLLSNDSTGTPGSDRTLGQNPDNARTGLVRRGGRVFIPDLWAQVLYKKFRFEVEAVTYQGSLENTEKTGGSSNYTNPNPELGSDGWKIRQYMIAAESEFKAVEDKLKVGFGFGWASGDADVQGLNPQSLQLQPQRTFDRTFSQGRFHPNYRIDLILWRNIMSRVQGAYYFRPSVQYDFIRNLNGQKIGGAAAIIWSRASEFAQTPGHKRDLGLELNATLYYQSKDGALNDDSTKKGGFFTMLQYGVLFPLGGLGYQEGEKTRAFGNNVTADTETAHIFRWYMGILF
jgi:uncharacterized protein (TIGR04551 family)